MKKVMITTAAVALAFGLSPFANAQQRSPVPVVPQNPPISKNIDVTKTKDSHDDKTVYKGKAENEGAFGAAANNHSTAYTRLDVALNNAFNTTKIVNATKLDGYVSGNHIDNVGNRGGDAYSFSPGGYGGDGGKAKADAHSGKAYSYGGDGGYAKGGHGGAATAGGGNTSNGTNGGQSNGGTATDGNANGSPNNGSARDGDWEAGNATGGHGGAATGGNGGAGGTATSGTSTATATGGHGGDGGRGGDTYGGSAGTFNASNTLSGFSGAAGVTVAIQNTGIAALQQVGVTTMANVTVH